MSDKRKVYHAPLCTADDGDECTCRTYGSLAAPAGSAARKPATAFPVGSFILDEMQERGWTIEELTQRMGGDPIARLTVELLIHAPTKGATLDEHTATLLSKAFGTSKELWLKLDETWQQNTELSDGRGGHSLQ